MASRTIILCGQDWQYGAASRDEVQNDAQNQSVAPFLGPMSLGKPMDASFTACGKPRSFQGLCLVFGHSSD
jgi:hypothetical protein